MVVNVLAGNSSRFLAVSFYDCGIAHPPHDVESGAARILLVHGIRKNEPLSQNIEESEAQKKKKGSNLERRTRKLVNIIRRKFHDQITFVLSIGSANLIKEVIEDANGAFAVFHQPLTYAVDDFVVDQYNANQYLLKYLKVANSVLYST